MKKLSLIQYTAILLIGLSSLMNLVYYSDTGNFDSPIIEFEFIKTESDAKQLFLENNSFKKDVIKGVHNQNLIDYAYMITYSAFLILVFIKLSKHKNKIIYTLGIIFSVLALIFDVIENIQLFKISELLVARVEFSPQINILIIVTRIKWLSIAFALFILAFHYYKFNFIGKLFALFTTIPLLTAILSVFYYTTDFINYFTKSIIFGFVVLILWTFISHLFSGSVSYYNQQKNLK